MDNKSNLVIGAGITGITIARRLAEKGEEVFLVEKRGHIGGNCYDFFTKNGQYTQKYGPHIFHTKDKLVWDFLSKFTEWNDYKHKVLAYVDNKLIPLPFNLNSLKIAFSEKTAEKLRKKLLEKLKINSSVSVLDLKKSDDKDLQDLSNYVYSKIFLNYTIKQWGSKPEKINPKIINRVPIFIGEDNNYFRDDPYQGIPKEGYTTMFKRMLNHKKIKILLNANYKKDLDLSNFKRIIVTSPIDEFFSYEFGKLSYRKIFFKFEEYDCESFQKNSVINYPNDYDYTRVTECNKFLNIKTTKTTIIKEFPSWTNGVIAYPILSEDNQLLIKKYQEKAKKEENLRFIGRLAECKYYNMDQACKKGLDLVDKEF